MQRSRYRDPDEMLARASSGITSWVLGIGFLSLHATVFFLALVGLLLWNLWDNPTDLWALDVFRRWGALLLFHAVAVGAGWLALRLMRAEQRAIERNGQPANGWSGDATQPYVPAPNGSAWHDPAAVPANRMESLRSGANQADELARRFANTTVVWSSRLAQRTRSAMSQAGNRFGSKGAESAAADPAVTWPEAAAPPTDNQEFIARFGNGTGNGNGHHQPPAANGVTPAGAATPSAPEFGKEAGWTWVEAAAASWLARREREEGIRPAPNGAETPPPAPADDPAAPPA